MTFSIAGRCARTGQFGVAVTSSSPAVAARCAWARTGVGAVATQNVTDPALGARLLDLLETGLSATEALEVVVAATPDIDYRQLTVVGTAGQPAVFSGAETLGTFDTATGTDAVAAGNLLSSRAVPAAMIAAFEAHPEAELAERLIAGLRAGVDAGGEVGPVHSAGVYVVADASYALTDLRVDWADDDPIGELEEHWAIWRPQAADYALRAVQPSAAPSYGVPGDL